MNIFKGLEMLRKQQEKTGISEKPLNQMTYSELCKRAAELYEEAFEGEENTYWNID